MSSPLLQRLKAALSRQYDVERELGAGGMGTVFLGRDITLDRYIAIKILRPELATASAAQRFLREARLLASLSHPNVLPVHSAGEADGLYYYVMDYVEGETLERRLAKRGPLSASAAVKLGSDLLAALEAAHERGFIHRDVKPGNIFLVGERVLLGDFGIAKPIDEGTTALTEPGHAVGTPAYMPPEQLSGDVTPKTDLYAVGMVLYETLIGRRWSVFAPPGTADWLGIPPRLARVLRRALASHPEDRWEDASAFRAALVAATGRGAQRTAIAKGSLAGALSVAVVVAAVAILRQCGERPPTATADLAILPFDVIPEGDLDGRGLARDVARRLALLRDVKIVNTGFSFPWADSVVAGPAVALEKEAAAALGAARAARATVYTSGNPVEVSLAVFDSLGASVPAGPRISLRELNFQELSDSISLRLARVVLQEDLPDIPRLTANFEALRMFIDAEAAFERGAWQPAVSYYEAAVELDSTFVLAWWHLANAWRWLGRPGPYPADYRLLFDRYGSELGPLDSALMAAQLAPPDARIALYHETLDRYPSSDFAAYLYGEELFNRGALWGRPLAEAAEALETAVDLNPYWASAYVHLAWANLRLGRKAEARRALDRLRRIAPPLQEGWLYPPELLDQAYAEHFAPLEVAASGRRAIFAHPTFGQPEWLAVLARLTNSLDLPATQVALGRELVRRAAARPQFKAGGHFAQGLGLFALGRLDEALSQFDSAASLGHPDARLQALQWRVLPRALLGVGWSRDSAQIISVYPRLEELAGHSQVGGRAMWTLALDRYAAGDTAGAGVWLERLRAVGAGGGARQLVTFLEAMKAASLGQHREALARSQPLLVYQLRTASLQGAAGPHESLGDPFARAALHLARGAWYEQLADWEAAEREWRWYEAVDIDGFPSVEPPHDGEIDWAMGNYGRYKQGLAAQRRGDLDAACQHLRRAATVWSEAGGDFAVLARLAEASAQETCKPAASGS